MQWQEILEFVGGAAVFGSVTAYLGKVTINAFVASRIELYKNSLERITTEHAVRFQSLHDERAETIKSFYDKLTKLDDVLSSTLAPFQPAQDSPLEDKVQLLAKYFSETRDYFVPRRIFFDEQTCEQVDRILGVARGIFFDVTTYEIDIKHPQYKYDREILKERHEFWEKARTSHKQDFTPLKRNLENQFRNLLGIGV